MKKSALVALLLLAFSNQAFASFNAYVTKIKDGDTIVVIRQSPSGVEEVTCRLADIDAPEKAQAFGNVSRQTLAKLIFNKNVIITITTHDRYGRAICDIDHQGQNVNEQMVKLGMAWVFRKYNTKRFLPLLEEVAKGQQIGLWSDPHAIPPWEYRKLKRSNLIK